LGASLLKVMPLNLNREVKIDGPAALSGAL